MKCLIDDIKNYSDLDINSFVDRIHPVKKERLMKMNPLSYKQSVVGEILLSKLLQELNINYDSIIVNYNENGKPFISNYPIYYNISHDEDLVICVIHDGMVGVDLLRMKPAKRHTAKVFCTDTEYNYITSRYKFYQLYTLKEAYLKLFGKKINDIKELNIVSNNQIKLNVIYRTMKHDDYLISICYLPK